MRSAVLLTTDTPHHRYFAKELATRARLLHIVVETSRVVPAFHVEHAFEALRDRYEKENLPGGELSEFAPVLQVDRANDAPVVQMLEKSAPDFIIAFGTRLLKSPVIKAARVACVNLHGGDPSHYRGLDTHLWTIYHGEFERLVTALHHVDLEFDTGPLVELQRVPVRRGMELHELRAENTKVCVDLVARMLHSAGPIKRNAQPSRGRYYSFMPACLKEICVQKFRSYAGAI